MRSVVVASAAGHSCDSHRGKWPRALAYGLCLKPAACHTSNLEMCRPGCPPTLSLLPRKLPVGLDIGWIQGALPELRADGQETFSGHLEEGQISHEGGCGTRDF